MSDYEPGEVERVASQVTTLLQFSAMLVPDLQMLKDTVVSSGNRASFVHAAAPIIGAMGGDYEGTAFEAELQAKRAKALVALIECIADTETERLEFNKKQAARADGLAQLRGLGLA